MKSLLLTVCLLCVSSLAWADAETRYTHCLSQWSAQGAGETCFAWAQAQGFPTYGAPEERSTVRAFALCETYFAQYLNLDGVARAIVCDAFSAHGPSFLPGW